MKTLISTMVLIICIVAGSWPATGLAANSTSAANAYQRDDHHETVNQMSPQKMSRAKMLATEWRPSDTRLQGRGFQPGREFNNRQIVRQVQQRLKDEGYYFNRVDGISGPGTKNAIKVYQHAKGVKEDGRITRSLLELMHISPVVSQPPPPGRAQGSKDFLVLQKRLQKLIKQAKRRGGADPWLLARLERLAGTTTTDPWPTTVIHEDFLAPHYQGGNDWRVVDGRFSFEPGMGLVGTATAALGNSDRVNDLAVSLLDVLLNQKNPSALSGKLVKIERRQTFTGPFSLTVTTGPLRDTRGLLFSCTDGSSQPAGYQLALHPGQRQQAKLFRVAGKSATEIEAQLNPGHFPTNTDLTITWTRARNGKMFVTVNGKRLLSARDTHQGKRGFDTLAITHLGQRVVFREIELRDNSKR